MKRSFPISIHGERWRFRLLTKKQYAKYHGENDPDNEYACVDVSARTIDFLSRGVTEATIRHELWHVYSSYLLLGSTNNISLSDVEEINAEMFEKYAPEMLEKTSIIYSKLKGALQGGQETNRRRQVRSRETIDNTNTSRVSTRDS